MKKEWAMRKGITPVRYYHANSPFQADTKAREILDMLLFANHYESGVIETVRRLSRGARQFAVGRRNEEFA